MRGYLGPWTGRVLDFLHVALNESGFACHKTIEKEGEWTPRTRVCAGSLIFANKTHKCYRNPELRKLQEEAPDDPNILGMIEFTQYHNRKKGT
jgi:hypothetical protein